jgi:hypothetical protein
MIQRIQSVFLLLLVISMLTLLFIPIWEKTDPETGQVLELTAFSLGPEVPPAPIEDPLGQPVVSRNTTIIGALAVIAALIALYEIFQYRNRLTQLKLGLFNSVVLAGLLGACVYFSTYVGEDLVAPTERGSFEAGFFLPILAMILNLLANRFIRRDENLVRSMDRLR